MVLVHYSHRDAVVAESALEFPAVLVALVVVVVAVTVWIILLKKKQQAVFAAAVAVAEYVSLAALGDGSFQNVPFSVSWVALKSPGGMHQKQLEQVVRSVA